MTAAGMERMDRGAAMERWGMFILRYGLAIALLWIGALKFTTYEANNIQPLVANSPLFSWALHMMTLPVLAKLIGTVEMVLGLCIALRPVSAMACYIGSIGATLMFLLTMSFLLTTPGVWEPGYGFPFPSGNPGQLLIKDLLFLGTAIWSAGEARRAMR